MYMNTRYRALFLLTCCLIASMLYSKTVKPIMVANGLPYTDHIALSKDATDRDIMVKFQFNEDANTLTVSVVSYRTLFVFWEDTRYKSVISHRWIHTDRLPYIAQSEEGQRFRLSKALCRQLPKPKKEHIFKKWMTYEGLQPQEKEIKMVNSFIEQIFDIQNNRNLVKISINDIMLLDLVRQHGVKSEYSVSYGNNLDTEYHVTIQRNPCFGLDKEAETTKKALDAITKSYKSLKRKYGNGTVSSADGQKAFEDLKVTLTAQYQHNNDSSACPMIQDNIDNYNVLVDSLASMKVRVEVPAATAAEKVLGTKGSEANGKIILSNARQIDSKVARWLSSRDALERADIVRECQSIIKDTQLLISGLPLDKWGETIKIFRQAEKYFNKTCR